MNNQNNKALPLLSNDKEDIDDVDPMTAYFDDEKIRRPKTGKRLKKFKHPGDR